MPSPFLEKICPSAFSRTPTASRLIGVFAESRSWPGPQLEEESSAFLGGKLKVAVLYLGSYRVCQGRVAGFFGFFPVFSGNQYMYFGVICEMMGRLSSENTMDCGVDADGAKLRLILS